MLSIIITLSLKITTIQNIRFFSAAIFMMASLWSTRTVNILVEFIEFYVNASVSFTHKKIYYILGNPNRELYRKKGLETQHDQSTYHQYPW
jgi:hypothetical protein